MRYLLTFAALIAIHFSFGQNSAEQQRKQVPMQPVTNQQRYKVDYELKNHVFVNGDSSVLNTFSLESYQTMRLEDEDLEFTLPQSNLILVLYSFHKILVLKNEPELLIQSSSH